MYSNDYSLTIQTDHLLTLSFLGCKRDSGCLLIWQKMGTQSPGMDHTSHWRWRKSMTSWRSKWTQKSQSVVFPSHLVWNCCQACTAHQYVYTKTRLRNIVFLLSTTLVGIIAPTWWSCSDDPGSFTLPYIWLSHYFHYITDPPLCTPATMTSHVNFCTQHSPLLYWTSLAYLTDTWFTIHVFHISTFM